MNRLNQLRDKFARWCGAAAVLIALLLTALPAAAAETGASRVSFGQSIRVEQGERVENIITIGGDLTVLGEIEKDAVVIGGTLELGPEARVGGDAVSVGGNILAAESAVIGGDRVEVSGTYRGTVGRRNGMSMRGPLASSLATFVQVIGAFLLSALFLAFAPRQLRAVATRARRKIGRSILFALALVILFLPLLGALTISIVGIPLIPVAVIVLAGVLVFGMAALGLSIGYLMPFYSEERSAMGALAIGYLVIAVVALIPYVGAILIPLAALYAGGSVLATWFGTRDRILITEQPMHP